jgi:hypothetical protein
MHFNFVVESTKSIIHNPTLKGLKLDIFFEVIYISLAYLFVLLQKKEAYLYVCPSCYLRY